jgi:hypothetical protein
VNVTSSRTGPVQMVTMHNSTNTISSGTRYKPECYGTLRFSGRAHVSVLRIDSSPDVAHMTQDPKWHLRSCLMCEREECAFPAASNSSECARHCSACVPPLLTSAGNGGQAKPELAYKTSFLFNLFPRLIDAQGRFVPDPVFQSRRRCRYGISSMCSC